MDRYGSSTPYPYGYAPPSQPYPPPQIAEPYPPPQYPEAYPPPTPPHYPYPAPAQAPAPAPAYPYPYPSPAYPYPPPPYAQPTYPTPTPTPRPYSYSGPLPQGNAPPPSLQHSSSFQYGSHYPYPPGPSPYPPSSAPPQLPSRNNSFNNNQGHDILTSPYPPSNAPPQLPLRNNSFNSNQGHDIIASPYPPSNAPSQPPLQSNSFNSAQGHDILASPLSYNSGNNAGSKPSNDLLYPPLNDLMADMRLSDSRPSAPASPPAPSVPAMDSIPVAYPGSSTGEFSDHGSLYETHSRVPSWDSCWSSCAGSPRFESEGMQVVPFHKGSLRVMLLHGNLDIWVYEAKNLPNMDMFHKTLGDMFGKIPGNVSNKIEGKISSKITSDPYVSITVTNSAVIGRTYVISNEENPVWMQHFNVPVAHYAAEVHFLVKDSDVVGSQLIGSVSIPVEQLYFGAKAEGTYPILNGSGKQCKAGAVLSISIQYTPIGNLSIYHHGVGAGPDYQGVPGTYFPLRKGGKVTLYQDAHVPDGCLPEFTLDGGLKYVHGKCWQDIFDAIRQARRLVYITGWSVWHKVRLVRGSGDHASECSLGELLRSKSAEGVRVLLLVWDDPTSRSILGYKTDGIMATHDEETRRYFKHSSVQVLLCPRIAGKRHSWVKQREVSTIYTHHQKTVIVDADAGNNRRKIIAFVGGLDLCDGRYDTPEHPLFRTLETVHKDDYHNPSFQGNITGCPREPWHDLHCKIDGPAAYDVLTNFQERWLRASKPHGIKKLKMSYDDALLKIERLPDIVGIADVSCSSDDDPESWHVQVFRSIDSASVKGFPKNPKEATSKNLVCGKNMLIDMSIHTAYVKAIRSAQHYIYIENQYFIGSSYNWSANRDVGANNLIPMEIALKIAEKIKAHERFAAYIVVPMWPEGIPTGGATQRILFWQNKTMQMMYETIYKALVEVGLEDAYTPQDYLNFFCLGNREAPDGNVAPTGVSHPPNSPQAMCEKSRRFMIYVHSKGMIVDDEYVILGSANINQRSLEGTRDTEIAMGAYQPHHTWARKCAHPYGQIYGYRMSLWTEHLGLFDGSFNEPETLECVRKVRGFSEMNWRQFAAPEATEMTGHLLKYPVEVDRRGKVKPLPECENFPDLGGNICGSFLVIQENLTI